MKTSSRSRVTFAIALAISFIVGCGQPKMPTPVAGDEHSHDEAHGHEHADDHGEHEGHEHGDAPHGGTIADWDAGKYHVEFTADHDKKETIVYVLGSDAKSSNPIASKSITLNITAPPFQVELKPLPLDGEAEGMSSRFVGQHESLGVVQEFAGTISAEFDETPYTGEFKEVPHGDHAH